MELPRSNASMSAQNARCGSCRVLEPHIRCIPGIPGEDTACTRPTCLRSQASPPVGHHTVFGAGVRAVHSCGPQRYRDVEGCAHLYRVNGGVSRTCSMRTCARCPSLRFLNVRYRSTRRRPLATTASKLKPWPRPSAWHAMPRPRLAYGPVFPPPLGFLHCVAAARLMRVSSRVSDTS